MIAQPEIQAEILKRLEEHIEMARALESLVGDLAAAADCIAAAQARGGTLFLFGNGGSAAECQHLAAELVNRFKINRPGIPALALTTDTSILTSIANDGSFDEIFARQLEALGRRGDVALALSTSGTSPNVIRGLDTARRLGMTTVALTGASGGDLESRSDWLIRVPSQETARIQEGHLFLGHCLCELLENHLRSDTGATPGTIPPAAAAPPAAAVFIHPSSFVDEGASVGEGTRIWHFCHIQSGARVGSHCILGQNVNIDREAVVGNAVKIQNNVAVYRGVVVEDDAFLGPSMVFTNVINPRSHVSRKHAFQETRVGRGATIGANATVVCGHQVGRFAFVGAGAVVTRDVPAFALVTGNPARVRGWMCQCGEKLPFPPANATPLEATCASCHAHYQLKGGCTWLNESL